MQAQENQLVHYLTHGGCTYKLLKKESNLILEVENSSSQKASISITGVDSLSFTPKLDPLSKSNAAQIALTFKETSGAFKSSVYLYNSSEASLTEQGGGYVHTGKLLNIHVCGPVNREKLCTIYSESGITKVQILSVNSDTGAIVSGGPSRTVNGLESSVTAISASEVGRGQRITILAKDGTTLKKGSSIGNSITMHAFTPTGGLSGNKVDKIILSACKENKVCAIVSCTDGKLYYLKSSGNNVSSSAAQVMSCTGNIASLSVDPEYESGSTVSGFNIFVIEGEGSVKKATFNIHGNQCEKSSEVTVTEEINILRPLTTTTDQANRESTRSVRRVASSRIVGSNLSSEFTSMNKAATSASAATQTTTLVAVRKKATTRRASSALTAASRTASGKERITRTTDIPNRKVTPIVIDRANATLYNQASTGQFFGGATVQIGSNSTTVTPTNTGAVLGIMAGSVLLFLLFGFLWLIHYVYQGRTRMRHLLEVELSALAMENLDPCEEDSDEEIPSPLRETSIGSKPERHK